MKNNKSITKPYVGMRIKVCLPTVWCQVHSDSPYQWLKGYIREVPNENTITISIKSKKVGRIERMMCFRDKNGMFNRIIECL